jgi:uncharacterized protein
VKKSLTHGFLPLLLVGLSVLLFSAAGARQEAAPPQQTNIALTAVAGPDRVVVMPGKTYLNGWAGYGAPPDRRERRRQGEQPPVPPVPPGPAPTVTWSRESGPGTVTFADAKALVTSAAFSAPGEYVLKLVADNGKTQASSTLKVVADAVPPPANQLSAVYTKGYRIDSPFWKARIKSLIVNWIPHCIDMINRTDLEIGPGGIDNFVEAGNKLAGRPYGYHKGYVFSNAWVHQTVESMSIALMIDPQGDPEIIKAQAKFRTTLDDWIPKILSAQEPDGYLQTAFTLPRMGRDNKLNPGPFGHWVPEQRGGHEGYVAGYFLESAINHYMMTGKKDARLYNGAKKLADCWVRNLGPAPKKEWFDGHQEMEQALVRFGRFVNDMEGGGKGNSYIQLAKFLLDSRKGGAEYDQSHLPVVQQYEAAGHAVRAVYTYSGMADVAVETHDLDYHSAVRSIWDNIVNRKYYLTGGVGTGESSEGFGPNYSMRQNAYCESCSSCGLIFMQYKMNMAYHDAKYADLYEDTLFNALLGSVDLEGKNFYYQNPLDAWQTRYDWHVCPCCVGNIPRTLMMLPTWAYAKTPDSIYVNLFAGIAATIEGVAGTDVEMVQATDYPWSGNVSITVNPKAGRQFSVRIRVPDRSVSTLYAGSPEANGIISLAVNGSAVKPVIEKGYAVITRAWKAGDKIDLVLPMKVQRVRGIEAMEATRGKVALRLGPLVYNIEQVDQDITQVLPPDAPLAAEWDGGLLGGVMVIKGAFAGGGKMIAVPNYARLNRGPVPPEAALKPGPDGRRPTPPPPTSIVWIKEK